MSPCSPVRARGPARALAAAPRSTYRFRRLVGWAHGAPLRPAPGGDARRRGGVRPDRPRSSPWCRAARSRPRTSWWARATTRRWCAPAATSWSPPTCSWRAATSAATGPRPLDVGARAAAQNISDVNAMGGSRALADPRPGRPRRPAGRLGARPRPRLRRRVRRGRGRRRRRRPDPRRRGRARRHRARRLHHPAGAALGRAPRRRARARRAAGLGRRRAWPCSAAASARRACWWRPTSAPTRRTTRGRRPPRPARPR